MSRQNKFHEGAFTNHFFDIRSIVRLQKKCTIVVVMFLLSRVTVVDGGFASFSSSGVTGQASSTFGGLSPFCNEDHSMGIRTQLSATPSENDGDRFIMTTSNIDTTKRVKDKEKNGAMIDVINSVMKESRSSYAFIEGHTFRLLSKRPAVAFAIFIGVGLLVAYMMGFFFLEGYISSTNPYENGAIPYWEEDVLGP